MSALIHIDEDYRRWIEQLGIRFRSSRMRAAVKVNSELLRFYWSLGEDIVTKQVEKRYGAGIMDAISRDLTAALPGVQGFSRSNLYYIKTFYLIYSQAFEKFPQPVGKFDEGENRILPQVVAKSDMDMIFSIPWGHHRIIIDKLRDNPEKAVFFLRKTIENGWSRAMLLNFISTDLYERTGKAITNFDTSLPDTESGYDNDTIGLLICKERNDLVAQWTIENNQLQPIGISEYDMSKLFPENVQQSLPSIEDIENELKDKD